MAKLMKMILLLSLVSVGLWLLLRGSEEVSPIAEDTSQSGIFGRGLYTDVQMQTLGQQADPNYQITFPRDHGEHTSFDIEWWYLTANLRDQDDNQYGLQWTLFRFRNPSQPNINRTSDTEAWNNEHIYMAHASVHSKDKHWFSEKFTRGGVGNAGVLSAANDDMTDNAFTLFIDNWRWENNYQSSDADAVTNSAKQGLLPATLSFSLPLMTSKSTASPSATHNLDVKIELQQSGPYVLHGDNGYSIKSGNQQHASQYYSAPFIDVNGTFTEVGVDNKYSSNITGVKGQAWFDQEWTSQLLDAQTAGWDWMSLHLNDGSKLMAFRMRLNDQADYVTGSLISPQGDLRTLLPSDISLEPLSSVDVNGKLLPLQWRLKVPSSDIDIEVVTVKQDQWNPFFVSYYEGMVEVNGSHQGQGFLELTGY